MRQDIHAQNGLAAGRAAPARMRAYGREYNGALVGRHGSSELNLRRTGHGVLCAGSYEPYGDASIFQYWEDEL